MNNPICFVVANAVDVHNYEFLDPDFVSLCLRVHLVWKLSPEKALDEILTDFHAVKCNVIKCCF